MPISERALDMVLPGLKGNDMEILVIALFVCLIVSFVIWGYFAVQTLRNKQPIWKMLISLLAVQIFNLLIQLVGGLS